MGQVALGGHAERVTLVRQCRRGGEGAGRGSSKPSEDTGHELRLKENRKKKTEQERSPTPKTRHLSQEPICQPLSTPSLRVHTSWQTPVRTLPLTRAEAIRALRRSQPGLGTAQGKQTAACNLRSLSALPTARMCLS